ncbi:GAF domain-containing SpoIIE family protein phosphatase [Microbispora hainanensis]|uniref:GAF domain-containing SpoIIE family protein phosphatase n=1 Tax=Microbispora hainanensis TaxID=568844 RepID=UPI0033D138DA
MSLASPAEASRLAAVRRYAALETSSGAAFDRVAALAARIFRAPFATVTIVGDDTVRVIAAHGLPPRRGLVESLCAAAVRHGGPYVVEDAWLHPHAAGDPVVHGEPGIRFYAAALITTPDGEALGSVNVMDVRPREAGDEELACLRDLAGLVMDELEVRPDGDGFGVTLATGGHPPALAVRANGAVEPIHPAGGQLIGILRDPRFAQVRARLNAGDALLLYTDGLTEARTPSGSMLDEDGLTAYLAAAGPTSADDLLTTVHDLITALGAGVSDDTAVLALSVPPATRTPSSGSLGAA